MARILRSYYLRMRRNNVRSDDDQNQDAEDDEHEEEEERGRSYRSRINQLRSQQLH